MKESIEKLIARTDLTQEEAEKGVEDIIAGADPCQAAAFLVLLRAKVSLHVIASLQQAYSSFAWTCTQPRDVGRSRLSGGDG